MGLLKSVKNAVKKVVHSDVGKAVGTIGGGVAGFALGGPVGAGIGAATGSVLTGGNAKQNLLAGGTGYLLGNAYNNYANPITETGGVISTAPDGTQILYTGGSTMGILSSIGSAASSLLGNVGSSLISGGLSAYGNIYGADTSAANAKEINERQIQWERERATNAHQWEIQDLRNAGLNPVLSAGGQGAATGGISAVQPDTSGYGKAGEGLSNAIAIMQKQQEIDNQTKLTDAQSSKLGADTAYTMEQSKWLPPAQKASLKKTAAETVALKANTAKTAAEIENINKDAELKQAQIWSTHHNNNLTDAKRDRIWYGKGADYTGTLMAKEAHKKAVKDWETYKRLTKRK